MVKEMSEMKLLKKNSHLTIKPAIFAVASILVILILPSAFFSFGSIYESTTPATISYNWLNYQFGFIQVIIFFFGLLEMICQRQIIAGIIFFIALLREIIFYFVYDNSIFTDSTYEMYLTILVGYFFFLIMRRYVNTFESMDKFLGIFLMVNMLTIYINVAMGGRGTTSLEGVDGRYHASNLDVGATGTLCLLCIIYLCFSHISDKYRYPLFMLSVIGLILSGSRSALVFFVVVTFLYLLRKLILILKSRIIKVGRNVTYQLGFFLLLLGGAIMFISIYSSNLFDNIDAQRFEALTTIAAFSSDGSVLGRSESIRDAINIIEDNPLGISGYFINLQNEMAIRGFPTFPHSYLFSGYILFGPIVLLIYVVWLYFLKKNQDYSNKYYWIIFYYMISTVITGGPIVNFKVIFSMLLVTVLALKSLKYQTNYHAKI